MGLSRVIEYKNICRQIGVNLFTRKRVEVAADCGTIESNFESIRNEFEELGESLSSSPTRWRRSTRRSRRERERGRRASKGSCKLFFLTHQTQLTSPSTSLRTSQMSAHHFDEPTRSSAKEAIKRGEEEAPRRRRHKNHNKAKIGFHSGEIWWKTRQLRQGTRVCVSERENVCVCCVLIIRLTRIPLQRQYNFYLSSAYSLPATGQQQSHKNNNSCSSSDARVQAAFAGAEATAAADSDSASHTYSPHHTHHLHSPVASSDTRSSPAQLHTADKCQLTPLCSARRSPHYSTTTTYALFPLCLRSHYYAVLPTLLTLLVLTTLPALTPLCCSNYSALLPALPSHCTLCLLSIHCGTPHSACPLSTALPALCCCCCFCSLSTT